MLPKPVLPPEHLKNSLNLVPQLCVISSGLAFSTHLSFPCSLCHVSLSNLTNSKSPMPCPFCSCLSLSCIYDHWNSPMKTTAISSLCSQSLLSPSLWGVRIHLLGREAIRSLGPDQNHLEQGHCLGYVVCKSITSPTSSSASWMDLGTMPQVSCMTPWM